MLRIIAGPLRSRSIPTFAFSGLQVRLFSSRKDNFDEHGDSSHQRRRFQKDRSSPRDEYPQGKAKSGKTETGSTAYPRKKKAGSYEKKGYQRHVPRYYEGQQSTRQHNAKMLSGRESQDNPAFEYMKYEPKGESVYGLHPVLSVLERWSERCEGKVNEITSSRDSIHKLFILESIMEELEHKKKQIVLDSAKVQFDSDSNAIPTADLTESFSAFLRRSSTARRDSANKALSRVLQLAESLPNRIGPSDGKIEVVAVPRQVLDRLSGNRPHNGVVLDASPISIPLIDQLRKSDIWPSNATIEGGKHNTPVWLVLDGLLDPQNVGAVLRTAAFYGCGGVILCGQEAAPLSPVVAKASSGAVESMRVLSCRNLVDFLLRTRQVFENQELPSYEWDEYMKKTELEQEVELKERGKEEVEFTIPAFKVDQGLIHTPTVNQRWRGDLRIVALSPESPSAVPVSALSLPPVHVSSDSSAAEAGQWPATLLVVGSEGRGLSPAVARQCHLHATILPSGFRVESTPALLDSLNVSNAVAIALNQLLGTTCTSLE